MYAALLRPQSGGVFRHPTPEVCVSPQTFGRVAGRENPGGSTP